MSILKLKCADFLLTEGVRDARRVTRDALGTKEPSLLILTRHVSRVTCHDHSTYSETRVGRHRAHGYSDSQAHFYD
jgi:hypothetical protein